MKWSEYYEKYDDWQDTTQYSRLASITDFGPETSPSSEITDCVQYVDERTANRIIKLALKSGVRFSANEVADIIEYVTQEDDIVRVLLNSSDETTYSAELIERILNCLVDEEPVIHLIERICKKPNYFKDTELVSLCENLSDDEVIEQLLLTNKTKFSEDALNSLCDLCVDEEIIRAISMRSGIPYSDPDVDEDIMLEDFSEVTYTAPRKKGLGFFGTLAAIAGASSGFSEDFGGKKHNGKCDGNCANCPPHYGYRYGRWYYGHGHMHGCEFGGNRGGGSD